MKPSTSDSGVVPHDLSSVTLICVTGVNLRNSVYALWRSNLLLGFGAVKIVSPVRPAFLPEGISHELPYGSKLDSIDSYSHYMIYNLWRHVDTEHCLVVQADGYIIHPGEWNNIFLEYDYIGAPWRYTDAAYLDPWGNHIRVGNGGFSLRSKALLTVPNKVEVPWDVNSSNFYRHMDAGLFSEDGNICVHNRHIFEELGCKWAPLEVAINFSREQKIAEPQPARTFGFHKRLPSVRERFIDLYFRIRFSLVSQ
jgi:hypothetical protein